MFYVKLSLLLTLIGGNQTRSDRGVRRRSQSHMLICGDPGCGKSQLMRFAVAVAPRSVLTTGIGTTGAGLTCTAVKDGNDWTLEAGALVLANEGVCVLMNLHPSRNTIVLHYWLIIYSLLTHHLPSSSFSLTVGVCCIDEFASIKEHDRATLHEAMEQQTVSVAKVSILSLTSLILIAVNSYPFLTLT